MATPKAPEVQRQALLVLGMHRSGTSALALALNRLGWSLGRDLLASQAEINLHGFGENQAVVDLNERILAHHNHDWYQPSALPADWEQSADAEAFCDAAREILAEQFADEPGFLIKDPRLCLTLPVWLRALEREQLGVRVILQLRHPEAVARSLQRRDSLPIQAGYLLWLQYYLAAEHDSRACERRVLSYEQLMQVGAPALQVYDDLDPSGHGDCGLDPQLCHHAEPDYSEPGAIAGLCERVRESLLGLAGDGSPATDLPAPAELLAAMDGAELAAVIDASLQSLVELSGRLVEVGAQHSHALEVIADKDRQLEDSAGYIARCEEAIKLKEREVEQAAAYARECEQVVGEKDTEIAQATRYAEECEAAVKAKDAEIEQVAAYARQCEDTVAARDEELLRIRSQRIFRFLHKLKLLR